MPIVTDKATGRKSYVSAHEYFRDIGPEFFFRGNDAEYLRRVAEARRRVLRIIRNARTPLSGRGTNHEVRVDLTKGRRVQLLADYIDAVDGHRARRVRKQRPRRPSGGPMRNAGLARSPQNVRHRRSALFGGGDIPQQFIDEHNLGQTSVDQLVERMRWLLVEDAILAMYTKGELTFVNDTWYVSVHTMDAFNKKRNRRRRIKNDRSWHGRANNARSGFPAQTAIAA